MTVKHMEQIKGMVYNNSDFCGIYQYEIDEAAKEDQDRLNKLRYTYIEPYLGNGAMFISLLKHLKETDFHGGWLKNRLCFILNDSIDKVIIAFRTAQLQGERLIEVLTNLDKMYKSAIETNAASDLYYKMRYMLNSISFSFAKNNDKEQLRQRCASFLSEYGLSTSTANAYGNYNIYLVIAALFVFISNTGKYDFYSYDEDGKCDNPFGGWNNVDIINDSAREAIMLIYEMRNDVHILWSHTDLDGLAKKYPNYFNIPDGGKSYLTNIDCNEIVECYVEVPTDSICRYQVNFDPKQFNHWIHKIMYYRRWNFTSICRLVCKGRYLRSYAKVNVRLGSKAQPLVEPILGVSCHWKLSITDIKTPPVHKVDMDDDFIAYIH